MINFFGQNIDYLYVFVLVRERWKDVRVVIHDHVFNASNARYITHVLFNSWQVHLSIEESVQGLITPNLLFAILLNCQRSGVNRLSQPLYMVTLGSMIQFMPRRDLGRRVIVMLTTLLLKLSSIIGYR